jgi:Cys-rich repeat protein
MSTSPRLARSLRSRLFHLAGCGLSLAALVHCGGSVSEEGTNDADAGAQDSGPPGTKDASPTPDAQCVSTPSQPTPRTACTPTAYPVVYDAGTAPACTTLAQCQDAGAPIDSYQACLGGRCSLDQCVTDSDCPTGQACGCADSFGGNAVHFNECVPTQCRTDSDCGTGFTCSPSNAGYCSSLTGFYCHSAADTCATSADCCPGSEPFQECVYQPVLGHFACQAGVVCSG